jgi:hypothetical protein
MDWAGWALFGLVAATALTVVTRGKHHRRRRPAFHRRRTAVLPLSPRTRRSVHRLGPSLPRRLRSRGGVVATGQNSQRGTITTSVTCGHGTEVQAGGPKQKHGRSLKEKRAAKHRKEQAQKPAHKAWDDK